MKAIFFAAFIALSSSASADMFKCKDADGKIAYQDAPCAGVEVAKLKRDTSVGDPAIIAKNQANAEGFNKRYVDRLEAQFQASQRRLALESDLRKNRALEDQAAAMHEQAAALETIGRNTAPISRFAGRR